MRPMFAAAGLLIVLSWAQVAMAEAPNAAQSSQRAELQRQATQAVYGDITTMLEAMQRARRRREALNSGSSTIDRLNADPPSDNATLPTYELEAPNRPDPCAGETLDEWKRCLGRVAESNARIGGSGAQRTSVTQQIENLRRRLNNVSSDAQLSTRHLQVWTAELRRTSQTLEAIRVNQPTRDVIRR